MFWILNSGFSQLQVFSRFLKHSLVTHNSPRRAGGAQPAVARTWEEPGKGWGSCPLPVASSTTAGTAAWQHRASLGRDLRDGKNNHFFLHWNCKGSTGFLCYLRGEKMTIWLLLRMAALRLETILIGIITSWFAFFACCLSKAGKQICAPCNKLLPALTLRKPKVWSLLAGVRVFVCQLFPQLEERCS